MSDLDSYSMGETLAFALTPLLLMLVSLMPAWMSTMFLAAFGSYVFSRAAKSGR